MQELVNYFVDRLEATACRVEELLTERFSGVLQHVRSVVARKKEAERECVRPVVVVAEAKRSRGQRQQDMFCINCHSGFVQCELWA